jgi:hypothetical protein
MNTDFENLNAIRALVKSRIREKVRIEIDYFFRPVGRHGPCLAYIGFTPYGYDPKKITHQKGIARNNLGKRETVADWVVRQISTDYPDWFIESAN